MKLKGLKVHGFKSFADSTEIDFHDGITAIVGPNGCGKSNISDAIRWVLGEQRPTAIRGAKMEEAIFQGTVHRRPVNRGTVALKVTNADRVLPIAYDEVEIGRTVYRDGGSEYSINRSSCRLKDVVDLCRDTGLGANAYAVIENRMIDAILSDRTEERRSLFEEAAGIGRYKDRRRGALRRLERAESDLQRLDDVIGEVETKVRSLARQKGKAERYTQLRARRLSVEVAVVEFQIVDLRAQLDTVLAQLGEGEGSEEGMAAALAAAESNFETLRLRQAEVEQERSVAASRLEAVREELARLEREMAVADERRSYANRRLAQIDADRLDGRNRSEAIERELETLGGQRGTVTGQLGEQRTSFEARRTETEAVRARLVAAREELDAIERRERDVSRRRAQLEIDGAAADAQAAELDRRSEQIAQELESTQAHIAELEGQRDLFSDRLDVLQGKVDEARALVETRSGEVQTERAGLEAARSEELSASERASGVEAQLRALEALERDRAGVGPAVRAVLRAAPEGVMGLLTDFIGVAPDLAPLVDAHLGPLAKGVVVRDRGVAERVAQWFEDEWSEGGGLILLPLDRVPEGAESGGDLLDAVEVDGDGAPWVRALLGGVRIVDADALLDEAGGDRLSTRGWSVDGRGVMRIGNPDGDVGILERQEGIKRLSAEVEEAGETVRNVREQREAAQTRVEQAETALEEARTALSDLQGGLRDAQVEVASQIDRKDRMGHRLVELERQLEGTVSARERAVERGQSARETRSEMTDEEESILARRQDARSGVAEVEKEWEAARIEESAASIELARLESELSRIEARVQDASQERDRSAQRIAALDDEEAQLRKELAESEEVVQAGRARLEELFGRRDEALRHYEERERVVTQVGEQVAEAERGVRDARSAERGAQERRHRLELEKQELVGRMDRIRDRLEAEWGRPLEVLVDQAEPIEGEPEELAAELNELVEKLARIGPVNMLAVEEHAEESERLGFLTEQRADLIEARDGLRTAIRQINETATELFMERFDAIRQNFRETFLRLFQGGEADLWMADPDEPLESPIEILASPRGKRTQRIDLLSGGERALTALSLLFGIYLVKPSPFCVLDEVDAPLDESNIGRFIKLLQDFKDQTQFVVITHNPRTIEAADWIYGVTMEEPGVSNIVGVRLEEALEAAGAGA